MAIQSWESDSQTVKQSDGVRIWTRKAPNKPTTDTHKKPTSLRSDEFVDHHRAVRFMSVQHVEELL